MKVTPIAHTLIDWDALGDVAEGTKFGAEAPLEFDVTDADHLAEFAGRVCYKAFDRKRTETATTRGYLGNILGQGHFSVLEHASITFHVAGVSRSLLLELERHRFLSFSVESQRYVDQAKSHPEPVIPPGFRSTRVAEPGWTAKTGLQVALEAHYRASMAHYKRAVALLIADGEPVKKAREAARAFLPNATPVDFVVTGNLRAWRDVLGKRHHIAADAEIREFAGLILGHLRQVAPFAVQDIPKEPYA